MMLFKAIENENEMEFEGIIKSIIPVDTNGGDVAMNYHPQLCCSEASEITIIAQTISIKKK